MALRIEVVQDEDPYSPRECDNVGTIALASNSRYAFGDERKSVDEMGEIMGDSNMIWLPVYIYDHSGITINTTGFSCPWDSGKIGIIYCSKEKAVQEWGRKNCTKGVREKALSYMKGEIKTLDQYLRGDVYSYFLKDENDEIVDSCSGFYGYDIAMEEAIAAKQSKEEEEQHA